MFTHDVGRRLLPLLCLLLVVPSWSQTASIDDFATPGMDTYQARIQLTQADPVHEVSITLPPNRPASEMFEISIQANAVFTLLDPSGQVISPSNPMGFDFATITNSDPLGFQNLVIGPGKTTMVTTAASRAGGIYRVRVSLPPSDPDDLVIVTYVASGRFAAVPVLLPEPLRAGEPATVGIFLHDGDNPISTATVSADIFQKRVDGNGSVTLSPLGSVSQFNSTKYRYEVRLALSALDPSARTYRVLFRRGTDANFQILTKSVPIGPVSSTAQVVALAELELLADTTPDLSKLEWTVEKDVALGRVELSETGPGGGTANGGLYTAAFTPSVADTLSNSQCEVDLAASSAQPSGNTLTKWKY